MKHKKSIGCCLGIILCVVGFIAFVNLIFTGPKIFYELGDDYARHPERHTIVKIVTRFPNEEHTFKDLIPGPGNVVEGNYDDNYIIVHQIYHGFYSTINLPSDYDATINKHDKDSIKAGIERLRKMKECYWIIYKKKDIIAGPFNKHDFDIKCKKEGIDLEFSLW